MLQHEKSILPLSSAVTEWEKSMTTKQVIRDKKISNVCVWKQSKSWIYQSNTAFISDPLICWFHFAARHWMGNECYSPCLAGRSWYVGLQALIKSDRSQFLIFKQANVGYGWKERLANLEMSKRICKVICRKARQFNMGPSYLILTSNLCLLFVHLVHQLPFNTRKCSGVFRVKPTLLKGL